MKLYSELAEYYFSIESNHRNIDNDIGLVRSIALGKSEPRLLDLGCGTGEHLHGLSRYGIKCVGIDNSIEMINVAKKRFPDSITFQRKNFKNFDFYNEFDIITSFFGSMVYLINDSDVDNFFWNTWRALKPGGTGVFELWNSEPVKKIRSKPISRVSTTNYNGTLIERERGFQILEDSRRTVVEVKYRYHVHEEEGHTTYEDTHVMRAFKLDEITKFIKENGLNIKNIYANSLKEPFNENSNKIFIIFTRED